MKTYSFKDVKGTVPSIEISFPASVKYVQIPYETARLVDRVFLPTNPNKMRSADPSVVAAAKEFKAAVAKAAEESLPLPLAPKV